MLLVMAMVAMITMLMTMMMMMLVMLVMLMMVISLVKQAVRGFICRHTPPHSDYFDGHSKIPI